MKKRLSIIVFIVLVSISLWSCEKENKIKEIVFEPEKCPCAHETNFIKNIPKQSARMFNSAITTFDEMKEFSADGECSKFISYNINSDTTYFYSICNTMMGVGYICNFPPEMKESEIRKIGIMVKFSADEFEECITTPTFNNSYSNLVLISLEYAEHTTSIE